MYRGANKGAAPRDPQRFTLGIVGIRLDSNVSAVKMTMPQSMKK